MCKLPLYLAAILLAAISEAQTLTGTIEIHRKLTRRSVTADVPLYQRGPTVKLAKEAATDPLDFERSHVLIYLEGPATLSSLTPKSNAIMRQHDRMFEPDLVIIAAGTTVTFPNTDPIFHNVFSLSSSKSFDLGSYDQGDARHLVFPKPGIVSVFCHLHPNMSGTIFVAPNGFYTQSDRAGNFSIPNIPPGTYTVVAWHKAVGPIKQVVHIEAGKDATTHFILPFLDDPEPPTHAAPAVPVVRGR